MTYVYLVAGSLILFVAFVALTMVEARTGTRLFAGSRQKLDRYTGHLFYVVSHVNWSEFIAHMVQSVAERILHDIAYASLAIVRFIERQLTRMVRYLRDRRPNVLAPSPSRQSMFSQTVSYIRKKIRR